MSAPRPFPAVLPVYDPAVATRSAEDVLPRLAAGGARWVEYRDKSAGDRDFLAAVRPVAAVAREHGLLLLVNDRVDVARLVGAGVHLGQEDLPAGAARDLLGADAVIGLSADSLADVVTASGLPVDYVAVGPVYATGSKADAGVPVGLEQVAAARAATGLPLVAIGGIGADTAAEVTAAGADCVAVLSALTAAADVLAAMRELLAAAERGRRSRTV